MNLPLLDYRDKLRTKRTAEGLFLWDLARKKWLIQTREELVRQLLVLYLHHERGFPTGLMQTEKKIVAHGHSRRFDLLCYRDATTPLLLAECKAPEVILSQDAIEQVAIYNYAIQAPFLLITNGIEALCCAIDCAKHTYHKCDSIPFWK